MSTNRPPEGDAFALPPLPESTPLLAGVRRTGYLRLITGMVLRSWVNGEGMKETYRISRQELRPWDSAAEFHVMRGVATVDEQAFIEGVA